jgi:hypothetical protein
MPVAGPSAKNSGCFGSTSTGTARGCCTDTRRGLARAGGTMDWTVVGNSSSSSNSSSKPKCPIKEKSPGPPQHQLRSQTASSRWLTLLFPRCEQVLEPLQRFWSLAWATARTFGAVAWFISIGGNRYGIDCHYILVPSWWRMIESLRIFIEFGDTLPPAPLGMLI